MANRQKLNFKNSKFPRVVVIGGGFAGYFAWLLWSFVHLISISGFKNKILVCINWIKSYFSYEKSNRLIIKNE